MLKRENIQVVTSDMRLSSVKIATLVKAGAFSQYVTSVTTDEEEMFPNAIENAKETAIQQVWFHIYGDLNRDLFDLEKQVKILETRWQDSDHKPSALVRKIIERISLPRRHGPDKV